MIKLTFTLFRDVSAFGAVLSKKKKKKITDQWNCAVVQGLLLQGWHR